MPDGIQSLVLTSTSRPIQAILPSLHAITRRLKRSPIAIPCPNPFDRLLICQAIEKGRVILTPDPLITQPHPGRNNGEGHVASGGS